MAVTIYPNIERRLARTPGVRRAVDDAAKRVGRRAEQNLASNRDTGNARIEVDTDGTDALVSLVDPNGNALAIEFGHHNNRSGRYVEGSYVLTTAVLEEASNDNA